MGILQQLGLILVLIAANAYFAAAEIALVSANETRLQTLSTDPDEAPRRRRKALRVLELRTDSTKLLATIQVGITLISFFNSASAALNLTAPLGLFLEPFVGKALAEGFALTIVTSLLSFVSLILGELVPKQLALRYREAIALAVVDSIVLIANMTKPLVNVLKSCTQIILNLTGTPPGSSETLITIEELKAHVDVAAAGGTVDERERRMIRRVVGLSELTARAVMVPRILIQYLKTTTQLQEACQFALNSGHTRFPVCQDNIDRVIGILHVKDLVRAQIIAAQGSPAITLTELLRPVRLVPSSKSAGDLLAEMQKDGLHMVMVIDEFGGTAGLITVEDLLEEIVGEIRDEYDAAEEAEFNRISPTEVVFNIRASLSTVNNEMNLELPRDQAATLAGLFLEEYDRQPQSGDYLKIDQVLLRVMEDGQRVRVVLVNEHMQTPTQPETDMEDVPPRLPNGSHGSNGSNGSNGSASG